MNYADLIAKKFILLPDGSWAKPHVPVGSVEARRPEQPALQTLVSRKQKQPPKHVALEADLHQQIIDECNARQWGYLHGAMCYSTHRTLGEPDFTILASGGRVFFVECKRRGGKLSPPQLAFRFQSERNGHVIHVVTSLAEFQKIIA